VLRATTARNEVDIARTFDDRIHLALLDIKLPDMTSAQVYPLLMDARPDLKLIVFNEYSIDGPAQEILNAGADGLIQKPFLISKLAEKLKEVSTGR
jgi:two-component system cell cycle sensor histidine kinase/response regulator CckA